MPTCLGFSSFPDETLLRPRYIPVSCIFAIGRAKDAIGSSLHSCPATSCDRAPGKHFTSNLYPYPYTLSPTLLHRVLQTACRTILGSHPTRECVFFGQGSGFGYERTPYCSYASLNKVHVLFSGEVAEWPGLNSVKVAHDAFIKSKRPLEEDDAHFLLHFYDTFSSRDSAIHENEEMLQRALDCLAAIKGSFSFVIYDELHHRVLAARDADGNQPLYWGATETGQLLFGTRREDLENCNPTATEFPNGSFFSSVKPIVVMPGPEGWIIEGDEMPGQLLSFVKHDPAHYSRVKAIPRITSKGIMHGAVYKVSSQADLEHTVNPATSVC